MKSSALGKNTSVVEVESISKHGLWMFVQGREYYLSYDDYPWFKGAKISEIHRVRLIHGAHLYWADLDVDLELESLQHPEKYPLIYRQRAYSANSVHDRGPGRRLKRRRKGVLPRKAKRSV